MTERNTCYEYLDIRSNKEWKSSLDELDTFIEKAQKKSCKKYIIYKVIKNVDIIEKNEINIGATIDEISDIVLESHVIIEDSSIEADSISLHVKHLEEDYDSEIVHKVSIIDSDIKDDDFSKDEDLNNDEDLSDKDDYK